MTLRVIPDPDPSEEEKILAQAQRQARRLASIRKEWAERVRLEQEQRDLQREADCVLMDYQKRVRDQLDKIRRMRDESTAAMQAAQAEGRLFRPGQTVVVQIQRHDEVDELVRERLKEKRGLSEGTLSVKGDWAELNYNHYKQCFEEPIGEHEPIPEPNDCMRCYVRGQQACDEHRHYSGMTAIRTKQHRASTGKFLCTECGSRDVTSLWVMSADHEGGGFFEYHCAACGSVSDRADVAKADGTPDLANRVPVYPPQPQTRPGWDASLRVPRRTRSIRAPEGRPFYVFSKSGWEVWCDRSWSSRRPETGERDYAWRVQHPRYGVLHGFVCRSAMEAMEKADVLMESEPTQVLTDEVAKKQYERGRADARANHSPALLGGAYMKGYAAGVAGE